MLVKTTMVYSQDWGSNMSPMNSVRAASLHTKRSSACRGLPVRSHLGNKKKEIKTFERLQIFPQNVPKEDPDPAEQNQCGMRIRIQKSGTVQYISTYI